LDTPENLKAALGRDIVMLRTQPAIPEPEQMFTGLGVQDILRPEPDLLRMEMNNADSVVGDLIARVGQDYHLESVRVSRPTLDDVFLHYTGRALRE
jgi:ABC-2 type transport system ATP-binding protein